MPAGLPGAPAAAAPVRPLTCGNVSNAPTASRGLTLAITDFSGCTVTRTVAVSRMPENDGPVLASGSLALEGAGTGGAAPFAVLRGAPGLAASERLLVA